jgi:hypothetical protein
LIASLLCASLVSAASAAAAPAADGGGLTEEALERIHSGIPVTLRHRAELVARRAVPLLGGRTIGRAVVEVTARYDTLTRQYDLERHTRVEVPPAEPQMLADSRRTESEDEMRAWMTRVDRMPPLALPDDVPSRRLKVRIESWLGRKYLWYMLPWSITVSAEMPLE